MAPVTLGGTIASMSKEPLIFPWKKQEALLPLWATSGDRDFLLSVTYLKAAFSIVTIDENTTVIPQNFSLIHAATLSQRAIPSK